MREKWESLALREKRTVAGGGFALLVILAYLIIWLPLSSTRDSLQKQIEQNQQLLLWMHSADSRLQSIEQHLHPKKSSQSIQSLIQTALNSSAFNNNVTGLRQVEQNAVQVNLKNVSFDNLMKWLIQLSQQNNIQITELSATPSGESGMVTLEVVLKNPS